MAEQWYFAWDDKRFGPFSAAQLKDLAALGRLQPTDTVWKEGIEKGVLADQVKNLFPTPQGEVLPGNANASVASETSPPLQRSKSFFPSAPNQAAKLDPWLAPANDPVAPDGPLQDIIPDGLMLKGIPEGNGSASSVPPALANSPGSGENGERNRATSPMRKGFATAVRGAVIISQNGETVRFKKKCAKCGYQSASNATVPVGNEDIRRSFFCPKCQRIREIVIQGS
jgi:GYF domain 2